MANINNKDVLEDWSFLTDDNELCVYEEYAHEKHIVFTNNMTAWELTYKFNYNKFSLILLGCLGKPSLEKMRVAFVDISERLKMQVGIENIVIEYTTKGLYSFECGFYFKEKTL